jgi:hypothetical protein
MQETERGTMPIGLGDSSGRILIDDDLGKELWQRLSSAGGEKSGFFGNGVKDCVKLPDCLVIVLADAPRMLRAVPRPARKGVGRSAIGLLPRHSLALLRNDAGVNRIMPPHFFGSGEKSLAECNTEGLALTGTSVWHDLGESDIAGRGN